METSRTGTSFNPEEAYAAAAERFFELMKTFGMAGGTSTDWKALAAPLATQFERWLQMSQAMTPWFSAASAFQSVLVPPAIPKVFMSSKKRSAAAA